MPGRSALTEVMTAQAERVFGSEGDGELSLAGVVGMLKEGHRARREFEACGCDEALALRARVGELERELKDAAAACVETAKALEGSVAEAASLRAMMKLPMGRAAPGGDVMDRAELEERCAVIEAKLARDLEETDERVVWAAAYGEAFAAMALLGADVQVSAHLRGDDALAAVEEAVGKKEKLAGEVARVVADAAVRQAP